MSGVFDVNKNVGLPREGNQEDFVPHSGGGLYWLTCLVWWRLSCPSSTMVWSQTFINTIAIKKNRKIVRER